MDKDLNEEEWAEVNAPPKLPKQQDYYLITWSKDDTPTTINGIDVPYILNIQPIPKPQQRQQIPLIEDLQLTQFSTIHLSHPQPPHTSLLAVPCQIPQLFFMFVHESGGGQSYHEIQYIYVSESKEKLVDLAGDFFDCEHREDDCQERNQGECRCEDTKKGFLGDLEGEGSAGCQFVSGKAEGASFQIVGVPVNQQNMDVMSEDQEDQGNQCENQSSSSQVKRKKVGQSSPVAESARSKQKKSSSKTKQVRKKKRITRKPKE